MTIALVGTPTTNTTLGGTTVTTNVPAGVVNNHVLLAMATFSGGSGTSVTPPAGWTQVLRRDDGTTASMVIYYHVANSEPANYTWTASAAVQIAVTIIAYSGVDTAAPIDTSNSQVNASSTTVTAPSITLASPNELVLLCTGAYAAGTYTAASGYTIQIQTSSTSLQDQLYASSGATGAISTTFSTTTGGSLGALVALKEAPPPPTLEQEGFRFRNDDGSETTATWKAAQDTSANLTPSIVARIRVLVNATGDPTAKNFRLEYKRSTDPTAAFRKIAVKQ